jgi:hypothetical protein
MDDLFDAVIDRVEWKPRAACIEPVIEKLRRKD